MKRMITKHHFQALNPHKTFYSPETKPPTQETESSHKTRGDSGASTMKPEKMTEESKSSGKMVEDPLSEPPVYISVLHIHTHR